MPTLQSAPANIPTLMLSQSRVIRATRARVYEAWTNPEMLAKWFGPAAMYCPSATLDVRVGGEYHIDIHPVTGTAGDQAASGRYTKIITNELLQFTWSPNWNVGEESLVTISLKDVTGGTEITIVHENFSTETSRDGHNTGWMGCLDKLADLLQN